MQDDTEYEIALKLIDPDGGNAWRTLRARTRSEPTSPISGLTETSQAISSGPTVTMEPNSLGPVDPGTNVNLQDGDYGDVIFHSDGAEGKPVVYRSESGLANFSSIDLRERRWVHLDGVTVKGGIRLKDTRQCVVRNCDVSGQYGITAYKPGTFNTLIEDNTVTGIRPWEVAIMGAKGENSGEGIQITGSGNVIRYNRVTGFRDCLSQMEDKSAVVQMCNDWHNNDVIAGLDDGIEADFADSNCRVYENRITNCFVGISSQPGLGGPNYFFRNVMYNVIGYAFKLHRHSEGDVILHNTVVKMGDGMSVPTKWDPRMFGTVHATESNRQKLPQRPAGNRRFLFRSRYLFLLAS